MPTTTRDHIDDLTGKGTPAAAVVRSRGRSYVPGHDRTAAHDRIGRQRGSTQRGIRWFDGTYGTAQEG